MYKCTECGFTSVKKVYCCPKCKNTEFEEFEDNKRSYSSSTLSSGKRSAKSLESGRIQASDETKKIINTKIRNSSKEYDDQSEFKVIKETVFEDFNDIISTKKGFLESQVIMLSADPGTGKSTFCTQISSGDTLYISSEETFSQIKNRFDRCNKNSNTDILSTSSADEALAAIEVSDRKFIIVDSINNFENGTLSYQRVAQLCLEMTSIIKRTKKCAIIISQVGRSGETIGMSSMIHAVDTCLSMSRSPISENITMVSTKNRFNEVGSIALFRHREGGLEQVEQESMEFSEGTICFYMQAGSKKLPFSIQTLICGQQDNRPQRVGIGISKNQIMLWNGIIGVNDNGYSTIESDIYMSTSNGLILQPGNDVAAIASILSSYYCKIVNLKPEDLVGSVSLNGSIYGNKRFKHIKELIYLYKK